MTTKDCSSALDVLRHSFSSQKTKALTWRFSQLKSLRRMVIDNEAVIMEALQNDLGWY